VENSNGIYPDPEMERDVFEGNQMQFQMMGSEAGDQQDVFELLRKMQESSTSSNQSQSTAQAPIPETNFTRFIKSKYPVIIIAFIVYIMHTLQLEIYIGSSVFSLFILWEVFEFILTAFVIKTPAHLNVMLSFVSAGLGISQNTTQFIIKVLGLTNKIMRDIAIFLFTFVLLHITYSYAFIGASWTEILDKDFKNLLAKDEL
jgi:hypothetical protein